MYDTKEIIEILKNELTFDLYFEGKAETNQFIKDIINGV